MPFPSGSSRENASHLSSQDGRSNMSSRRSLIPLQKGGGLDGMRRKRPARFESLSGRLSTRQSRDVSASWQTAHSNASSHVRCMRESTGDPASEKLLSACRCILKCVIYSFADIAKTRGYLVNRRTARTRPAPVTTKTIWSTATKHASEVSPLSNIHTNSSPSEKKRSGPPQYRTRYLLFLGRGLVSFGSKQGLSRHAPPRRTLAPQDAKHSARPCSQPAAMNSTTGYPLIQYIRM